MGRTAWTLSVAVVAGPFLSACADTGAGSAGSIEVRDSAGVELVHNPRVGLIGERAELEEVLRIGAVEGEDPYMFSRVFDLAVGADGTYYVGNGQTGTVRVFGPDGKFVREFGGLGQGPGEFTTVNMVERVGDDIAIVDWQRGGRLGVFSPAGELLEFHGLMTPGGARTNVQGRGPHGWLGGLLHRGDYPRETEPGRAYEISTDVRVVYPGSDSAGPLVFPLPPRILYGSTTTEGLDWPLYGGGSGAVLDVHGRLYRAHGDSYRVDLFDADGRLIRSVTREYDAIPVQDAHIEELIAKVNARFDTATAGTPDSREREHERLIARIREQASFPHPATLPPLGALIPAEDGSFWVERIDGVPPADLEFRRLYGGFGSGLEAPVTWDVFDAQGRFLAGVELPARFNPRAVTERTVTGVLRDELDVEYVVRYRLR
jgi:hypothetical protein